MMNILHWYQNLIKPHWAPPAWLFGPVWSVLYLLIAISFGYVFWQALQKNIPAEIAVLFGFNLILNAAFSPIQFQWQNNLLASIDIVFVLGTLVWAMVVIWPYAQWVVWINLPYLAWVLFAIVLQLTITVRNA
ncbi:MAG TPA: TspO/MBR family protein [Candidatus Paceibacterota bacterium]|nr:TspO/MBR family protein [Candidatus Paceibacterota bacterium]